MNRILLVGLLPLACGGPNAIDAASDSDAELLIGLPERFADTDTGGTGLGLQLAQDRDTVFWFNEAGGYIAPAGPILQRNKNGLTPPTELVASAGIFDLGSKKLASDGTDFFFYSYPAIYKVEKSGGAPIALTSTTVASAIAVDRSHVYFTTTHEGVLRVSKNGGDTELVAPGYGGTALAIDEQSIYFADDAVHAIVRVSKSGGAAQVLVSSASGIGDLEVDSTSIYFSRPEDGIVAKAWKSWPSAPIVLVDEEIDPNFSLSLGDVAIDLLRVYWQENGTHRWRAISKWGGLSTIVAAASSPGFALTDSTHFYWSEDAAIMRARK
jgi:hypothetical protein